MEMGINNGSSMACLNDDCKGSVPIKVGDGGHSFGSNVVPAGPCNVCGRCFTPDDLKRKSAEYSLSDGDESMRASSR